MFDAVINGANNFFSNPFRNRYEGACQGFLLSNFLMAFITEYARPEDMEYVSPIVLCVVMSATISGGIIGFFRELEAENPRIVL